MNATPNETVGLCLVDGGTIEISADPGMTLEQAREAMAPPDFTGLTLQQLREMGKSRDFGFEITPEVEKIMLANFEIDPRDDTVRARFPRKSHMAVIDAFWAHRPSELYQRVACPVLLMPTKSTASPAQEWDQARRDSIETAVRLLPNSKTVWLEDSIHDVPLQRPELVASVIEDHVRSGFLG